MDKQTRTISSSLQVLIFTACFAAFLFYVLPYHEVWRDEMHDLSMVQSFKSPLDLLKNTSSHGFPALWYLALYAGYQLTHTVLILKLASIFFVTGAVYLFLRFAPFSGFEKFLFTIGYFPLYEYSIISRSYCLSMLLFFGICSLYPRRFEKFPLFAFLMLFLANTSAHALVLCIALTVSLAYECLTAKPEIALKEKITGFLIIIAGIALAIFQILPDPQSIVKYYQWTPQYFGKVLNLAVFYPGNLFAAGFGIPKEVLTFSFFLFYIACLRRPAGAIFFFLSTIGLCFLFLLFYPGAPRHQGFLYLAIIAVFWMERISENLKTPGSKWKAFALRYRDGFFLVLLMTQAVMGYTAVSSDLSWPYSSSGDFAAYLKRDPRLRHAILVPEPDYLAEPIPFYTDNPIYLTREHRYGNFIHFTAANDQELSLGKLLDTAKQIQAEQKKPVLIMLGHSLSPNGPFAFSFSYAKIFRYSPEELKRLHKETTLLTQFTEAMSDEDYDIFLLKDPEPTP